MRNVHGQVLRVGARRGERTRPELLIFNGIGASIELVASFAMRCQDPRRSSCAGCRRLARADAAFPSMGVGAAEHALLDPLGHAGCVMGRRACPAPSLRVVGRVFQKNEWRRSANEIKAAFARNSQIDADNTILEF
jgi:hypothetical protein